MKYIDDEGFECEDVGNCKICNEDTWGDNDLCITCREQQEINEKESHPDFYI
jgi:hypothetical protein